MYKLPCLALLRSFPLLNRKFSVCSTNKPTCPSIHSSTYPSSHSRSTLLLVVSCFSCPAVCLLLVRPITFVCVLCSAGLNPLLSSSRNKSISQFPPSTRTYPFCVHFDQNDLKSGGRWDMIRFGRLLIDKHAPFALLIMQDEKKQF